MELHREVKDGIAILSLKGKLTLGEGDEVLKDAVNTFVVEGIQKVVLDLSLVPYIDSAGLGEIVRAYTHVSRSGGKLVLVGLTKRIEDLLSITKLRTVFDVFDTPAEAVSALQ